EAILATGAAPRRHEPGFDQSRNYGAGKAEQLADFAKRVTFGHDAMPRAPATLTLAGFAPGLGFGGDPLRGLALRRFQIGGRRRRSSLGLSTLAGSFVEARAQRFHQVDDLCSSLRSTGRDCDLLALNLPLHRGLDPFLHVVFVLR